MIGDCKIIKENDYPHIVPQPRKLLTFNYLYFKIFTICSKTI